MHVARVPLRSVGENEELPAAQPVFARHPIDYWARRLLCRPLENLRVYGQLDIPPISEQRKRARRRQSKQEALPVAEHTVYD